RTVRPGRPPGSRQRGSGAVASVDDAATVGAASRGRRSRWRVEVAQALLACRGLGESVSEATIARRLLLVRLLRLLRGRRLLLRRAGSVGLRFHPRIRVRILAGSGRLVVGRGRVLGQLAHTLTFGEQVRLELRGALLGRPRALDRPSELLPKVVELRP